MKKNSLDRVLFVAFATLLATIFIIKIKPVSRAEARECSIHSEPTVMVALKPAHVSVFETLGDDEETEQTFIFHEEIPLSKEYQEWIELECERLGVNKGFAYALIESESSFRTGIVKEDGGGHSAGLCQINSVNWPDMEKQGLDPFNEFDNITYCLSLVAKYLDKYDGSEELINTVITCYKAGEGGAKRLNYRLSSCEHIKERMDYFNDILNLKP